jgi:phosphoglycolate phosphatase-like HAD superfamily hydrolase
MVQSHVGRRAFLSALIVSTATAAMPLSARLALAQGDPLPSWNDGANKQSILNFVVAVTKEGSADFIPAPQRIATFDNDGTLWCEQPMYVQLAFALERVKALSNQHPEWKTKQPFKAVLDSDIASLAKSGEKGLLELVMATHAGMTTEEFTTIASDWIKTARHPKFKRPYTDLVYQPMLELLTYLRANGFKTFIVSGGGIEFMRPWAEKVYGIPPDQVVGSSIKTKFQMRDGQPELFRLPAIDFVDDGPGKPVGINAHIGQRPIAAFGNSDGDIQMLQWATKSGGRRFGLIVHHTDAAREYGYDRKSHFGKLDKGFDAATVNGWTLVSMKDDWKTVFKSQ